MRRVVEANLRRLGFDLPLAVWCAAPSEPVIATRGLSGDDDVIAHQMAGHAMRAEHRSMVEVPEVFVCGLLHASDRPALAGSGAFPAALCCRTARLSSGDRPGPPRERVELGLRRRGQEDEGRERGRRAAR